MSLPVPHPSVTPMEEVQLLDLLGDVLEEEEQMPGSSTETKASGDQQRW